MGAGFAADIPAVKIKERATHFYAGETVRRTLLLEFPPDATAPRTLNWWLTALNAPLAQGTIDVPASGGLLDTAIEFALPDIQRRTLMHLRASLTQDSEQADLLDREMIVYPRQGPLSTVAIKGKRFGVIDPNGRLTEILMSLEVKVEALPGMDWVESFDGDGVIVDTFGFSTSGMRERFFDALAAAELDFPVLILPQLTNEGAIVGENGESAEILAPGHPVFYDLEARDLAGWQPEGMLGVPLSGAASSGAFRSLATLSDEKGAMPGSLLLEQITPRGRQIIHCQMPLVENWDVEPVCRILMINLLTHMVDPASHISLVRRTPAFYGDKENKWLSATAYALTGLDPRYDDPPIDNDRSLGATRLVILDAGYESIRRIREAQPEFFESLEAWVRQGGFVFVFGLGEENIRLFEWALGEEGSLDVCVDPELNKNDPANPLMWGISAGDLASWVKMIEDPAPINVIIPDPRPKGWTDLIDPPALSRLEFGEGCIIFCGFYPLPTRFENQTFWAPVLMNHGIMLEPLKNE